MQSSRRQWYPRLNNPTLSQHNIHNRTDKYSCIPANDQNSYSANTTTIIAYQYPRSQEKSSDEGRNQNFKAHQKSVTLSYFPSPLESYSWKYQPKLQQCHSMKTSSYTQLTIIVNAAHKVRPCHTFITRRSRIHCRDIKRLNYRYI